jgi:predicted nucleic acid-binding protein
MPSSNKPTVYVDACVLISLLGDEHSERVADIEALLERGASQEIDIITSTFTVVEVAFAACEKQQEALDDEQLAIIDALYFPSSPIVTVEFHLGVARLAREAKRIAMQNGWKLRSGDAVHLATAKAYDAIELATYNVGDFEDYQEWAALTVREPSGGQMALALPESTSSEAQEEESGSQRSSKG